MTDLLSMLMHSRTQAHVFHLRVSPNGLAPHLALQTYYEDIIELILRFFPEILLLVVSSNPIVIGRKGGINL